MIGFTCVIKQLKVTGEPNTYIESVSSDEARSIESKSLSISRVLKAWCVSRVNLN